MKNITLYCLIVLIVSVSVLKAEEQETLGIPRLDIITKNLDFGNVTLGEERILEIQVKNISIRTFNNAYIYGFTIAPDNEDFFMLDTISEYNPVRLYEGDQKNFEVKFRPKTNGEFSSVLYIKSNAEGVVPIYMTGKCVLFGTNIKHTPVEISFKTTLQKDTISKFVFIESISNDELEIMEISIEKKDKLFSSVPLEPIPIVISDMGISVRVDLVPYKIGTYTNNLIIKSNDSINPHLKIPIIAQIGVASSVEKISESPDFDFSIIEEGNTIKFSLVTKIGFKDGEFAFYSQEGKLIKTVLVSGNTSELLVSIDKSELPKLSFIRFTQGERVYTHKFVRE